MLRWILFLRYDLKNILRDGSLIMEGVGLVLIPLFIAFLPIHAARLLSPVLPLPEESIITIMVSLFLQLLPMLASLLTTNLYLEESEEGILKNYHVTIGGRSGYEYYRTASSLPFIVISLLAGFVAARFSVHEGLMWILPITLEGPFVYLLVIGFARDRMEGLAMGKVAGGIIFAGVIGNAFPAPWRYGFAMFPSFWITHGIMSDDIYMQTYSAIISILLLTFTLWFLLHRKFIKRSITDETSRI